MVKKKNRFVQLLQNQPSMNNGSHAGGLAHALQQGMTGYMAGQGVAEDREAQELTGRAFQLMQQAPQTIQWNQPDAQGSTVTQTPDGMSRAAQLLMSNPQTAQMGQQLVMQGVAQKRAQQTADQQYRRQRADTAADRDAAHLNALDLERERAAGRVNKPQTVTTAEGVFVLNPDGTKGSRIGAAASQPRTRTVNTAEGVFTLNPDGSLGSRIGSPVRQYSPPPSGYSYGEDGELKPIPGGPADKVSAAQGKAIGFADRMEQSEEVLSKFEAQGTDFWKTAAASIPGGNHLLTPEYRRFDQAKRNFINAVLRQESGAAIAASEFENAEKQYFPIPGDDPATIKQKRQNRAAALNSMRQSASGRRSQAQPGQDPLGLFN